MTDTTNSYWILILKHILQRTGDRLTFMQIVASDNASRIACGVKTYINGQIEFWNEVFHDPCDRTKAKIEALANTALGFFVSFFTSLFYVGNKMDDGEIDFTNWSDLTDVSIIFVTINVARGYVCRRFFAWRYGCSQSRDKSLLESFLNALITFIASILSYRFFAHPLLEFFDASMSDVVVSTIATVYFTFLSIYRGYWVRIFCMKLSKPTKAHIKLMNFVLMHKSSSDYGVAVPAIHCRGWF